MNVGIGYLVKEAMASLGSPKPIEKNLDLDRISLLFKYIDWLGCLLMDLSLKGCMSYILVMNQIVAILHTCILVLRNKIDRIGQNAEDLDRGVHTTHDSVSNRDDPGGQHKDG
jgi:hypothetical protein